MADKKADKGKSYKPKWLQYTVQGDKIARKKRSCPRCGPGVFLAEHKGRVHCGKCGYAETQKKQ